MDVFIDTNKGILSSIQQLTDEHNSKVIELMQKHIRCLTEQYQHSIDEQERLKAVIADLEEQNKSFMNVSLIIATKNENIRLQNEIQLLMKRLKHYENTRPHMNRLEHPDGSNEIEKKVQSATIEEVFIHRKHDNNNNEESCAPKQKEVEEVEEDDNCSSITNTVVESHEEHNDEHADEPDDDDDEEEISVVEKLIEGTTYFVSDDEHMLVYERVYEDDDWEIGEEIGHAFYDDQNILRLVTTD